MTVYPGDDCCRHPGSVDSVGLLAMSGVRRAFARRPCAVRVLRMLIAGPWTARSDFRYVGGDQPARTTAGSHWATLGLVTSDDYVHIIDRRSD